MNKGLVGNATPKVTPSVTQRFGELSEALADTNKLRCAKNNTNITSDAGMTNTPLPLHGVKTESSPSSLTFR